MAADGADEYIMPMSSRRSALSSFLAGAAAATLGMSVPTSDAHAAEGSRTIGQISGSGLVFKDTLVVESFDDPKVKGVTLYVSNFERPLTGELSIISLMKNVVK
jgi:catabolite regulation protein CreA